MKILELYTKDESGEIDLPWIAGKNCKSITQHSAQGEGDKWYYDVERLDGKIERLFNFESAVFAKEKINERLPF